MKISPSILVSRFAYLDCFFIYFVDIDEVHRFLQGFIEFDWVCWAGTRLESVSSELFVERKQRAQFAWFLSCRACISHWRRRWWLVRIRRALARLRKAASNGKEVNEIHSTGYNNVEWLRAYALNREWAASIEPSAVLVTWNINGRRALTSEPCATPKTAKQKAKPGLAACITDRTGFRTEFFFTRVNSTGDFERSR